MLSGERDERSHLTIFVHLEGFTLAGSSITVCQGSSSRVVTGGRNVGAHLPRASLFTCGKETSL